MAKTKQGKRDVQSYTIKGTNKVVGVGDCVLMRSSDGNNAPYVARVEGMESDGRGGVKVRVRWYYRPEEAKGGRRPFHGVKELFLSDHYDTQSAHTIEGKCIVHSFKSYTKLNNVSPEDFYCRFDYRAATGAFSPDRVAVYCKCEMPYNPDDLMVQCEGCKDWFHPSCMGMTIEQAKKIDHYTCSDCVKENGAKRPSNSHPVFPSSDVKPDRSFPAQQLSMRGSMVGRHQPQVLGEGALPVDSSVTLMWRVQPNFLTQVVGFLTKLVSGTLLLLTGLTLTGAMVALVFLGPLALLTSPIWVPVVITLFFLAAVVISGCGFIVAVLAVGTWMYRYFMGLHPVGADRVDYVRSQIANMASHVKDYTREFGGYLENRSKDAAPGA